MTHYLKYFLYFLGLSCAIQVYSDPDYSNLISPDQAPTLTSLLTTNPAGLYDTDPGAAVTITGNGTIRFAQLFFYDSQNNLLGTGSMVDNIFGLSFTTGQTVRLNSSDVYQIAVNSGVTPAQVSSMKLYMDGGNQSSNGMSCQTFSENCSSGSACTSGQKPTAIWGASPTTCDGKTYYAYISENAPTAVSGNYYGFYRCTVNFSDGTLSSCAEVGPPQSSQIKMGIGSAINNGFIYFSYTLSSVTYIGSCPIDKNGAIAATNWNQCSTYTTNSARGFTLSSGYAYFNYSPAQLATCAVNASTGQLSSPSFNSAGSSNFGMAINNGYLYVVDAVSSNNYGIWSCPLSSNPSSFSCTKQALTNSVAAAPRGIAIYNNYLYFTNSSFGSPPDPPPDPAPGIATICSINSSDGSLSSCSNAGIDVSLLNGSSSKPAGVTAFNGHLYITDQSTNDYILVCTINNANGSLSACARTASDITTGTPIGISIF